jgi:serine/threonine-protein kinase
VNAPNEQPSRKPGEDPRAADHARLGTTVAGQVRHSVETLIGRAAVERGLASREQVIMAFEELKQLPKEERAARFVEVFVRRGVLSEEQIETLRAWVRDDAEGGAGPDPSGSSMVAVAAASAEPAIPGYRFVRKLGAGAMGTVVLARQESLDRLVAIKLLPPKFARDPLYIDRFFKEGKAAARLNDPNIVAAYDVGRAPNGMYYFVMEYIDGDTVFDRIQAKRRIPEPEALRIARQAASALSHAHAKGFIHRDVKPKNLMINKAGVVKLADLGLARAGDDATAASEEKGKIFGTPYYISPEQIRAQPVTPATDIYGLGATLYHMVTGRVPFEGTTPKEVMQKHLKEHALPPDQVAESLSGGISMIIEMMLAKDPRERYHSTDHLIEDLDLVAAGESPVHARPKLDAPGGGVAAIEGPQDSDLQIASVPRGPGLLSTPAGIAIAALLALSLAANAVMALLLLRR